MTRDDTFNTVLVMNTCVKNSLSTFQKTKDQAESKVLLSLLSAVEGNPEVSQRRLSGDLGVALGLVNAYIKRCVVKGWIRAREVSPKRISYFLTPEGFSEKRRMVADYLSRSLNFFRDAKNQCEFAFELCLKNGWKNIALAGEGDLRDIAALVAVGAGINVVFLNMQENFDNIDAVIITDVINPQATYDALKNNFACEKLLVLKLLHISTQDIAGGRDE